MVQGLPLSWEPLDHCSQLAGISRPCNGEGLWDFLERVAVVLRVIQVVSL